jgi:hypothetical protein
MIGESVAGAQAVGRTVQLLKLVSQRGGDSLVRNSDGTLFAALWITPIETRLQPRRPIEFGRLLVSESERLTVLLASNQMSPNAKKKIA